ncbi:transmembrane emp24 domain-containing protein p24delta3-like [Zingiber officinale]|uniref:transmembrane emp24 domain-containing protein p24delta3-like n=1 Tax=Zingiber officinale TaxID=94328 RepID=UPI001C4BDAD8|nr:transmembrane emp24 domain-containing protein p24delta3-like [Zingiber officinale]
MRQRYDLVFPKLAMAAPPPLLLFSLLLLLASPGAVGVWLNLPSSGTKCVSEEIQPNVVVLADYAVVREGDHADNLTTLAVKVTSPYGYTLHEKGQVTTGQFAFTTTEAGNYLACFWIDSSDKGIGASVNLDWKIGIAAKDWNSVAKKENIEGVELELTKLEAAVHAIHDNLLYLRFREAEMRTVSEKTNSRVAWLSILSLGVCISVSILQLWHLKGYFQKKKLI